MNEIKAQAVRAEVNPKQVIPAPSLGSLVKLQASDAMTNAKTVADVAPVSAEQMVTTAGAGQQERVNLPSAEQMQEAVTKLNEFAQAAQRRLDFQLDEDSGKSVIRVYDRETDELVRQIPSEQALELARRLGEEEPSLLFKAEV